MPNLFYRNLSRREFCRACLSAGGGLFFSSLFPDLFEKIAYSATEEKEGPGLSFPRPALYTREEKDKIVRCLLCPRKCVLSEGLTGFCRARENKNGRLYTNAYSNPCSVAVDPIEKKPFFHFMPGTKSFSIATAGCNLRCLFCQNWQISQVSPGETYNMKFTPEMIATAAVKTNCATVAYTYSEPVNFYEYMLDCSKEARKQGLLNVTHSNGYINEQPLRELCKYLDAADIDLKGFSEDYYRDMCQGSLEPVMKSLKVLRQEGVWLEITNLVVTGENDDPDAVRKMCAWIRENLGAHTPVHFSRFHPMYKLTKKSPTPVATLEKIYAIAREEGLYYPYVGNVPGNKWEHTYCQKCGQAVVKRKGYFIEENNIRIEDKEKNKFKRGKCRFCGETIYGLWSQK